MFGRKDKSSVPPESTHAIDFDDRSVGHALRGQWITLALASFKTTFSTEVDPLFPTDWDSPCANGVVHFPFGGQKLLRCEVILDEASSGKNDGSLGWASLTRIGGDDPYVLFQVRLSDPRGRIEKALHSAFASASLGRLRFVHMRLKRAELDVETALAELKANGFGASHPLAVVKVIQQTTLPMAPEWSWAWSVDS
jgi:hypothetical protein